MKEMEKKYLKKEEECEQSNRTIDKLRQKSSIDKDEKKIESKETVKPKENESKKIAKLKEELIEIEISYWKKDEEGDSRPNAYLDHMTYTLPLIIWSSFVSIVLTRSVHVRNAILKRKRFYDFRRD